MVFAKIKITKQDATGQLLFAMRAIGLLSLASLILALNIVNFQYKTTTSPTNIPSSSPLPVDNDKNVGEEEPALVFLSQDELTI